MLMDLKIKQLYNLKPKLLIQVGVSLVDSVDVAIINTSFLGWLLKL